MQKELNEWRDLRSRKAARKATKDAAAAAKKHEEEKQSKARAEAAGAEVARVLACPDVVLKSAAAEAKADGAAKPRKDLSAIHRCVLGLGDVGEGDGGSGGDGGGGSSGGGGGCEVCAGFLTPIAEQLKIDLAGTAARGSGEGERAAAADRALGRAWPLVPISAQSDCFLIVCQCTRTHSPHPPP